MSQSIENILSTLDHKPPSHKKNTTSLSTDLNIGYQSLLATISGGAEGGGNGHTKTAKKSIIHNNQITLTGEEREKSLGEKRK